MASRGRAPRRGFGRVRKLPSGRYQAAYVGPDLAVHKAGATFETKMDAEAWLVDERRLVNDPSGAWHPPSRRAEIREASRPPTLTEFAEKWLTTPALPKRPLKPTTESQYRRLLNLRILPTLGDHRLDEITPDAVEAWFTDVLPARRTERAHAYGLLSSILGWAAKRKPPLIRDNPCGIRDGAKPAGPRPIVPASTEELAIIVEHMPDRLRLAVLIAAWCGLRQGETMELRRKDVDLNHGVLTVSRGVTRVAGLAPIVGSPKSTAGRRQVAIPPHLLSAFEGHLAAHVAPGANALLFKGRDTGGQLPPSTLYRWFYPAREAANRPDLRWHDLRHTAGTMAAASKAPTRVLMNRLGHSSVAATLRYQHLVESEDFALAAELSRMAGGGA